MKSSAPLTAIKAVGLSLLIVFIIWPTSVFSADIIASNAYEVHGIDGTGNGYNDTTGDMGVGDSTDSGSPGRRGIAVFSLAGLEGATLIAATLKLTIIESRKDQDCSSGSPITDGTALFTNPGLDETNVFHIVDPGTPSADDYHSASAGNDPGTMIGSSEEPGNVVWIDIQAAMQERMDNSHSHIAFRIQTAIEDDGDGCNDVWFFATETGVPGTEPTIEYATDDIDTFTDENVDAEYLVEELLSLVGGAETSNEAVTDTSDDPATSCSGTFTNGSAVDSGFIDSGVILSSGAIANIEPPNASPSTSFTLGTFGDLDLDSLIPGYFTQDACILEFDFSCPQGSAGSDVEFRYIFASEEYNEYVNSAFNDVFGWFLNGSNIALIPGTSTPVAINNVNNESNSDFYNDNGSYPFPFPRIEADGFTTTLTARGVTLPAANHIKLAIGDAGDMVLDSWALIEGGSFECVVQLQMDNKPEGNPNCVKANARGMMSVAIYGSQDVDVADIDQSTILYAGAEPVRCAFEDAVPEDGITDLVCKFNKAEMNLPQPGDDCMVYELTGRFLDGSRWEGVDHICVAGDPVCEAGTPQ